MAGTTVKISAAGGGVFEGYLALPDAGGGPGLILAQEIFGINRHMRAVADLFAEEGYVVLAPDLFWRLAAGVELGYEGVDLDTAFSFHERFGIDQGIHDINDAIRTLRARPECNGKVGVLGFGLGGRLAYLAAARLKIDAAVSYYGIELEQHLEEARAVHCPIIFHFGADDGYTPPATVRDAVRKAFAGRESAEICIYPGADHGFYNPERGKFNQPAATLAHSRTIGFLHAAIGPHFDLEALWEKHVECEFTTRSVEETMQTMVAEPYVNHVPNMTGGYGYRELYQFYKNHFIPKVPKDTKIIPVSRTVGANTLVDEFIFCCTHDIEIDFMLPGIPPTGKYLEIPHVAVVHFRGGKIAHEHIHWDQATALVQLGLLDPKRLPTAGAETAKKILDPSLPSNTLMAAWKSSEEEKK